MPESTGALTEAVYYILLSLYKKPLHGYGMAQYIENISHGRVMLGAGTLYGALNTLLEKRWIIAAGEQGGRKKEYTITETGKRQLHAELTRLQELVHHGKEIIDRREPL